MRLYVYVLEGSNLHAKNNCYVKLQVGKHKSKTKLSKKPPNNSSSSSIVVWNEELVFRVHDVDEELVVSVLEDSNNRNGDNNNPGLFGGSGDLVGRVRIPVWPVMAEDNHTLSPTWFTLEKEKTTRKQVIHRDCGKILLTVSLHGKLQDFHITTDHSSSSEAKPEEEEEEEEDHHHHRHRKLPNTKHLVKSLAGRLENLFRKKASAEAVVDGESTSPEISSLESECDDNNNSNSDDFSSITSFEEALEKLRSSRDPPEKPTEDLKGGILVDQAYNSSPGELNALLFAPGSRFPRELAELQGTTDLHEGPWEWDEDSKSLTRLVSYTKAATKLVKAVKATEEQTYLRAAEEEFAVFSSVSTPDVPYGNSFKVELLYKISPEEDDSSRLVVSWAIDFLQPTILKSMIEGGARHGLKESFDRFAALLAENLGAADSASSPEKERVLSELQSERRRQSDWELAFEYFWNFPVLAAVLAALYVSAHILFFSERSSIPRTHRGLEFLGLDLPDSFGELFTCWVLIVHLERVYNMVLRFVQARLRRGDDSGVRGQGDGWVVTVALIEGVNLASLGSSGLSDPYVVLTCNAKTRTSSVKLQTRDPQWNEILEFDAMEEPPSVLDVEVFDFDGPFDQAASLGHAEVNFLRHTSAELADIWVPLEGKLAQSSQSKLRLRVFLDNTNGFETIREYLTKMEKEVGKKLNIRSPHRNSTFQKLFGLPPEEFLISDFTCQLKRKLPMQGRLFLSARIVGFYANLFGHKTKFFFLWEDIEDIQVLPPSLASVGSPFLAIVLKKDRGLDASHGAKSRDEHGRLRFYFQSFVSFNAATRTILALWRTRTLTPDQKSQIAEDHEEQEERCAADYNILDAEDAKLSKVYSAELPINVNSLAEMFDGGKLEHKVMEKSGCLNYTTTAWEPFNDEVLERRISYKFNRHVSVFGGEVTSTQKKSSIAGNGDDQGWIVDEVMTLHGVPLSDHFRVCFRYQIEKSGFAHNACKCEVYLEITWLKSTKFQQRISRNIVDKFTVRSREIFLSAETDILLASQI